MRVISIAPFREAALKYPNQADSLMNTYRLLNRNSSQFKTPLEMKLLFPSLDNLKYVVTYYVIDIGGNHLRMIAAIIFATGAIYVKHIVTHAEYDKLIERYKRGELP